MTEVRLALVAWQVHRNCQALWMHVVLQWTKGLMSGSQQKRCQRMMVLKLHSSHYCLIPLVGLREYLRVLPLFKSQASCNGMPSLSREAAAAADVTQKMTRRLKRRYDEIHHTAPVSWCHSVHAGSPLCSPLLLWAHILSIVSPSKGGTRAERRGVSSH